VSYHVFFDSTGQILAMNNNPDSFPGLNKFLIGNTALDIREFWINNGSLERLPPKPEVSGNWFFDYAKKVWERNATLVSAEIKRKRLELLMSSDWTDTFSAKARLGDQLYQNWQTYRQALRDITAQSGYPLDVVWPTAPQQ